MTRWTVFRCLLVLRQGARAHLHEAKQPALTGGEQVLLEVGCMFGGSGYFGETGCEALAGGRVVHLG
jgi:hypothetical protein